MIRRAVLLAVTMVAALSAPLCASAGSTLGGHVELSPAQGVPGTSFAATFTYSVTVCQQYSVDFWWDNAVSLGSARDTSTGQSCHVTIHTAVPTTGASPGTTHTITANSHPGGTAIDDGPGPSGSASFMVLQNSTKATTSGTQGGPTPPSTSASTTQSQTRNASTSSASQQSGTAGAASETGSAATTAAPTAGSSALVGQTAPLPLGSVPPHPGGGAWWVALLAAGAVAAAGAVLAYRSGRLRVR